MPFNADDSFSMVNGATNAFAGQTIASATWDAIFTDIQTALSHSQGVRVFAARTVNFNPSVAVDVAVSITMPTAVYQVDKVIIANANHSLSAAAVGLYTAIGGGGATIVTSQTLTITTSLPDNANSAMTLVLNAAEPTFGHTNSSLQFRIITAEGAAATADVILYLRPL